LENDFPAPLGTLVVGFVAGAVLPLAGVEMLEQALTQSRHVRMAISAPHCSALLRFAKTSRAGTR